VGDVTIGEDSSVWYGAVLRGDVGHIRIGRRTNVQDLVCIHMSRDISHAEIADEVTIGHGAVIHGARVEAGALIGIGSIVLDNAVIGSEPGRCRRARSSRLRGAAAGARARLARQGHPRSHREVDARAAPCRALRRCGTRSRPRRQTQAAPEPSREIKT
jgi:acetyltransferase-like isoleucine patch superfamily enzyme